MAVKVVMKQHGIVIEHWSHPRKLVVRTWLEKNFGPEGDRWGEEYNYGLENLWMNEDVFIMYNLTW